VLTGQRNGEREGRHWSSPEEKGGAPQEHGRRRRGGRQRGEQGRSLATEDTNRELERKAASGSASGWRRFFKTQYGRTGQSTVPVRCTPDRAQ
jgi:hypothetical protein